MLTHFSDINTFAFYITLFCIVAVIVLAVLLLRSGKGYSVRDAQSHAEDYAGVIKEGHGGLTAFLWFLFSVMLIWTIVYFVMHASEFAIIFSP
jgi:preprotein translocase subunit SecG